MLSDDQCEEIVMTAFELLERTGVDVLSPGAVSKLENAGCLAAGNRVRIPTAMVEQALRSAPSRVTLCKRNGKRAILMETDNVHYGPGTGSDLTIDVETGETRKMLKSDVANIARICGGLKHIDFVTNFGTPTDVPEATAPLHEFEALVCNTIKPILQPVKNKAQAAAVIEMAATVAGGFEALRFDPFTCLYVTQSEPLLLGKDELDVVMEAADKMVPVAFANNLIAGLTAPETSAGTIVVALANSLAALVVSQLTREGAPFITGGFLTIDDRANKMQPYGAPEVSLMGAGFANVLRFLRLPSLGFAGATDSKVTDAQSGLESAFSILHAGLAGTNMIYGAGLMESSAVSSPYLLVMADEVMAMTKRIMDSLEVNEDKMARGVIDEVQPGGHYLSEPHTIYYFRKEQFWPALMNRKRFDDWVADGAKTLGVRSAEKTQSLLKLREPDALPSEISQKLAEIVAAVEQRM